jgi:fatty acyl-CoA reductase
VACVRLPFLVGALKEPVPGWISGLQTVNGATLALASGLLRTCYMDLNTKVAILPIDLASNALLVAAWDLAFHCGQNEELFRVYNAFSNEQHTPTMNESVVRPAVYLGKNFPSIKQMLPVARLNTKQRIYYATYVLQKNLGRLLTKGLDLVACLSGKKASFEKFYNTIVSRIEDVNVKLHKIAIKGDTTRMDVLYSPQGPLSKADHELFYFDASNIDYTKLCEPMYMRFRREVLKEPDSNLEAARSRMARIEKAFFLLKATFSGGFFLGLSYLLATNLALL